MRSMEFVLLAPICILPAVAFSMRYNWILLAHALGVAGDLVLKVPRTRVKSWETAGLIVSWIGLFGEGALCVYLVTLCRPIPVLEFLSALTWSLLMLMTIGTYWSSLGRAYLEFRVHGIIVSGGIYLPWESIREWGWVDHDFTLQLKLRNAIVNYRLRPEDKQAVRTVLEKHVTEPSAAS